MWHFCILTESKINEVNLGTQIESFIFIQNLTLFHLVKMEQQYQLSKYNYEIQ